MPLINWSRFDYIGAVCFTGYRDRYELLARELERVGIKNCHVNWDFPSPYKEVLLNHVPMTRFNRKKGCFYVGLNNYMAIATAYNLGCNSCLIMEDDIRFLKDYNKIAEIIDSLPSDYDLAMLDHNKPCCITPQDYINTFAKGVNQYWSRFSKLGSSGLYAMSRKGMSRFLALYEAPAKRQGVLYNNDHYFRDNYLGKDANLYAARIPVGIQADFSQKHSKSLDLYYSIHNAIGAPISLYAI